MDDRMIAKAARVLCDRVADQCNVDRDDNWKTYGEMYRQDATAMLEAIGASNLLESLVESIEDSQAVVDQHVLNYGETWRPARLSALRACVAKARAAIAKATGSTT